MSWKLEHLGGYEMMRDGTRTDECKSHNDMFKVLESYEVLYYKMSKKVFYDYINNLKSDKEAYKFIEKAWSDRHDDGGGWGRVDCKDYSGLLHALKEYNFEFDEE